MLGLRMAWGLAGARPMLVRYNDRTTGRKGGKNIDDQNIQHIDQRYAGNRSLAD